MAALTLAIQNGIVMAFAVLYLPLIREFGASHAEVALHNGEVRPIGADLQCTPIR